MSPFTRKGAGPYRPAGCSRGERAVVLGRDAALPGPWTHESLRRESERELLRSLAEARDEVPADISVSTAVLRGRTAPALADLADGGGYDLVVTGASHRRRGVASALLRRCQAAVLAVNPTRS